MIQFEKKGTNLKIIEEKSMEGKGKKGKGLEKRD